MTDPLTGKTVTLHDIDPSLVKITPNPNPGTPLPSEKLSFGKTFTDHMLVIPWTSTEGWAAPEIKPYGPLSLEPSSVVLHYANALFEGLKAYRSASGRITLFRPDMNMRRMNRTAERIALPTFDGQALTELIASLVRMDERWIPSEPGHSLYIRPTLIGTQNALGVGPSTSALLFVICSPVGPYYKGGFKPIALLATTKHVRAAPGGIGSYKLAANYAPGIIPQLEAAMEGYAQNLWLQGKEHFLTEVGTMNLFVVLRGEDGATELVTPPLDDVILPGVTRDSVLALARSHASTPITGLPPSKDFRVLERPISMPELVRASKESRLLEVFGAGTAAIVCPVDRIGYLGEDIHVPVGEKGMGPICEIMHREIVGRQTGVIPSDWAYVVKE
ncbi:branched-chain amino acid aminotransferase II [Dacryopinax primogenitus]|uniref:Branched-chain-amino-acid aminotransferase n=1 Tax=Dacryopinax primogenitus (strain DJM 731) TaxID=1858805 RepID=M5FZ91_DACPD|nr:branched-chain amino acid aminotransferase II [Dacryopinax primogenitus]EJT98891.1 branched-chain amino acid aminotransferase II [Dacryopinax primogenitus]